MPHNKFAFARYQLIDQQLRQKGYVKTSSLAQTCEDSLGFRISQRSIQMDLDAMKNDSFLGFYAPIEYCHKRKAYYYSDKDYKIYTTNITPEEIAVLIIIRDYLKDKIEIKCYNVFCKIVNRLKNDK